MTLTRPRCPSVRALVYNSCLATGCFFRLSCLATSSIFFSNSVLSLCTVLPPSFDPYTMVCRPTGISVIVSKYHPTQHNTTQHNTHQIWQEDESPGSLSEPWTAKITQGLGTVKLSATPASRLKPGPSLDEDWHRVYTDPSSVCSRSLCARSIVEDSLLLIPKIK